MLLRVERKREKSCCFLSIWLMTGCACVLYTDKKREKEKNRKTVIDVLRLGWLHLGQGHHLSITKRKETKQVIFFITCSLQVELTVRLSRSNCMMSVLSRRRETHHVNLSRNPPRQLTLVGIFVQCIKFSDSIIKCLQRQKEMDE